MSDLATAAMVKRFQISSGGDAVIHLRWPILLLLVSAVGCSRGPGALRPPKVDIDDAAEAAISEFDQNSDGKLSKEEWSNSGALMAVVDHYDGNKDGSLDSDEIRAGLQNWQDRAVGPRPVPFVVQLDKVPLAGATVRLVPATFMGDQFKPATAEAGVGGAGHLAMSEADRPKNAPANMALVQPGLYSIEITHPSKKIPAKYNTQTTLGIEVHSGNPGPQGVVWSLSNK